MRARFLLVVALAAAAACSQASSAVVTSPAPRACPLGNAQADPLPVGRIVEQLAGHVPGELPAGFGLAGVWESHLRPAGGLAIWTDDRCREVVVRVYRGTAGSVDLRGPRVGDWTVVADSPECGDAGQGPSPCFGYAADSGPDVLGVTTRGLDRAQSEALVESIPT